MSKPLTKKEWEKSVANAWSTAIEATYKDMIEKAVLEEREACAKMCEDLVLDHPGRADLTANQCASAIRARSKE